MTRRLPGLVCLAALVATPLAGQSAGDLVRRGLAAYRGLELDRAATLLQRGLDAAAADALADSARATSYLYLGATQVLRGRPEAAAAAFREALAFDPRCRPDTLVFPPEVTGAFQVVRRTTAYVRIVAPSDTTVAVGGRYVVQLYASMPHEATVELTDPESGRSRSLYAGSVADSLELVWDGRDTKGAAPRTGPLLLLVTSRPAAGSERVTRLPLTVKQVLVDTLALPQRPADLPAGEEPPGGGSRRVRALAAGILGGLAVVLLPAAVASDGQGGSARFVVGGTLGLAGLVGFVAPRPAATGPAAANRRAIEAWRRAADSLHKENQRRREEVYLRIVSGPQVGLASGRQ